MDTAGRGPRAALPGEVRLDMDLLAQQWCAPVFFLPISEGLGFAQCGVFRNTVWCPSAHCAEYDCLHFLNLIVIFVFFFGIHV